MWKVMDFKTRLWLPCMVLVALTLFFGYQYYVEPDFFVSCEGILCSGINGINGISGNESVNKKEESSPYLYDDQSRIAVCLVGGARMFELTGRSLQKYVVDVYPNTDVFLIAPLDKDTHKFTLLAGRNLRAAKIFVPEQLPVTDISTQVITSWGSPHGMQGLLQYFNLVEGCWGMVKKYEVHHKFKYDWIVRARVDSYWSGPLPNISTMDSNLYYVAAGSDFHGLNDRFGMGNGRTSRAANSRLSLLPLLYQRGFRGLNSESAYRAQLVVSGVHARPIQLPFCVMTLRKEEYPPPPYGLLVTSMDQQVPVSGTYCRPCDKKSNETTSRQIVDGCMRDWDWPGKTDGVIVCDAREPWASNWREIAEPVYKRDVGEPLHNFSSRSMGKCVQEMKEFQQKWEVWDAPPADMICKYGMASE